MLLSPTSLRGPCDVTVTSHGRPGAAWLISAPLYALMDRVEIVVPPGIHLPDAAFLAAP